jgi:hypothetical protein
VKPVADALSAAQAAELRVELETLWHELFGVAAKELVPDLKKLRKDWFGPRVSLASLRKRIGDLKGSTSVRLASGFDPPLVLRAGAGHVVTPEGRVALEQLRTEDGATTLVVKEHPTLVETYREWSQEKLHQAVDGLEGRGELMYPVSIAAVIVLLCHGASSEDAALVIPRDAPGALVDALRAPLLAAAALIPGDDGEPGVVDLETPFEGYPVGRARTRLGHATLCRRPERGAQEPGMPVTLWIPTSEHERVEGVLADELGVRRRAMSVADAEHAVKGIIAAYEDSCPVLARHALEPASAVDASELARRLIARIHTLAAGI